MKKSSHFSSAYPRQTIDLGTFQVALWPQFHTFRVKNVPRIWKKVEGVIPEINPVFVQKATLDYLMAILHNSHTAKDASVVSHKRSRRENMSMEEHNAIRYAAGYVIRKLKKKYFSKNSLEICQCLINMVDVHLKMMTMMTMNPKASDHILVPC